ncbi:hypothetical protein TRFO_38276 [Tritrichomonas foetus]|uniref:EF-hand domain-containing protein n=1 Tax=Tritrichomonas foetus TaxID=1144522 RepID=A0A1J4J8V4_9EUKA|nr:hypothetical protein TRFO_38276 [Tritrichomonas foetus]|eukprot:OHS95614.1 hypothetical protein TRFO_38276 [Tritrichomonas foetus]
MTSNPTSIGQSPHEVSFDEEIELHPPNESSVWDIPPKSIQSRIGRRQTERLKSYKNRFLHDLREAFDYSDIDNNGSLTFDAWCFSSIKNVIHEGHLSQTDYENYFKRIDVDCDGVITWSELVAYLMKDIQAIDFKSRDDAAQFIRKMSSAPHAKSQCHREMIQQIAICNRIGEYITVSSDSIRFWNPSDLSFSGPLFGTWIFGFDILRIFCDGCRNNKLKT